VREREEGEKDGERRGKEGQSNRLARKEVEGKKRSREGRGEGREGNPHPVPGADVNASNGHGQYPLHFACNRGCKKIVQILIRHGANVNVVTYNEGFTPLHLAIAGVQDEIVDLLLENGADPNMKDYMGRSCWELSTKYPRVIFFHF
jgi:hypothetical protein